jgi:hypothetical protein
MLSNFKIKLNQVRDLLGLSVKLEQMKLIEGTIVEAESFEPGFTLFVISEDGTKSSASQGVHETESMIITVDEAGIIVSVEPKEVETEEVETPEETVEVEMEEEVIPQLTPEDIQTLINGQIEPLYMVLEEMAKEMVTIKEGMVAIQEKYSKFAKAPAAGKVPTLPKVEENTNSLQKRIERLDSILNTK